MDNVRALVIEDDEVDQMAFRRSVSEGRFPCEYTIAGSISEAKRILAANVFDIIIADYLLSDGTAMDILDLHLETPIIITTGAGSEQIAVSAMKAGAHDYLIKDPLGHYLEILPIAANKAVAHARAEDRVKLLSDKDSADTIIIGSSRHTEEIQKLVELAASSNMPVLITGETGTGKSLLAKVIHYRSAAHEQPLVSINCLTLPPTLIEAELFGHEKGAFTGASHARKGLFEVAEGGTIFLDEIGDMAPDLQAKLLDAIEEKRIRRLGSTLIRPVNVRIIASTNVDLETALGSAFRRDLYYRLSVIRIHIPPLRERKEDISALCVHFLKRLAAGRAVKLSDEEIMRLSSYDWPGNVRELRNIMERALIVSRGSVIRPSAFLGKANRKPAAPVPQALFSEDLDLLPLEEIEKRYIQAALDRFSGSLHKTADALGISLSTLKRRIRSYRSK